MQNVGDSEEDQGESKAVVKRENQVPAESQASESTCPARSQSSLGSESKAVVKRENQAVAGSQASESTYPARSQRSDSSSLSSESSQSAATVYPQVLDPPYDNYHRRTGPRSGSSPYSTPPFFPWACDRRIEIPDGVGTRAELAKHRRCMKEDADNGDDGGVMGPYERDGSIEREGLYERGRSYEREGSYGRGRSYEREGSYERGRPYEREGPYERERSYEREGFGPTWRWTDYAGRIWTSVRFRDRDYRSYCYYEEGYLVVSPWRAWLTDWYAYPDDDLVWDMRAAQELGPVFVSHTTSSAPMTSFLPRTEGGEVGRQREYSD